MNILLDANVCLDILLKRHPDHSKKIIKYAEAGNISVFISASIVHILTYYTCKNYPFADAQKLILRFLDQVEVLDIPHKEIRLAISTASSDLEDAIQERVAIYHDLDVVVTNDKGFIKRSTFIMPIISVHSFLEKIKSI